MKELDSQIIFAMVAIGIIGFAAGGIGYSLFFTGTTGETIDIKYGGQYYPGEFLLKGNPSFWDTYDLNVKHTLFSSGTENNEALLSGEIDINVGSDTKTIALFNAAAESGSIEPLIIGTVQRGDRYSTIIPADKDYTWADLTKANGKTVGYRAGTGADTIMRRYFAMDPDNLNLSFDDFNWQTMNVEDMPSALAAGQIDAFTAWEPTPTIAVDQGVGKVLRSYGDVALVPVSIHTTKAFAYSHPALVVAFLATQIDKQIMIETQKTTAATYAAEAASKQGSSVSANAFELLYDRIDYTIEFNQSIINDILATADFLKNVIDPPKITEIPTLEWDTRFVEAAKVLRNITQSTAISPSSQIEGDRLPSKGSILYLADKIARDFGLKGETDYISRSVAKSIMQAFSEAMSSFIAYIKS